MIEVRRTIQFTRAAQGRKRIEPHAPASEGVPEFRIPRVSRLMALAIRFDGLLRDGVVPDMAELARISKVTQPRMSQIMNLLHLAPDIQEDLLFLPAIKTGRPDIHEKGLRPLTMMVDWDEQRMQWAKMTCHTGSEYDS